MTIIHIGELPFSHRMNLDLILIVGIKSTADQSAQSTLISAFEALAEKCVNEKTGKLLITSFKCGKQNSPEGMTKGLEMIFVLEFEVCCSHLLILDLKALSPMSESVAPG